MQQARDLAASRPAREAVDSPGDALANVLNSASLLARAEARLAMLEAKASLVRLSMALGLGLAALSLFQILVLLAAVSPLLLTHSPWQSVALMLALVMVALLVVASLAARELRRLQASASDLAHSPAPGEPTAGSTSAAGRPPARKANS